MGGGGLDWQDEVVGGLKGGRGELRQTSMSPKEAGGQVDRWNEEQEGGRGRRKAAGVTREAAAAADYRFLNNI